MSNISVAKLYEMVKETAFQVFNIGYHAVKRFCKSEKECRYIYHMFYKKNHPILNLKQTGRNLIHSKRNERQFIERMNAKLTLRS